MDELRQQWLDLYGQDGHLVRYHSPGCKHCDQSGFKGRLGLQELLTVDQTLRHQIQTKAASGTLQHSAMASGHFRTLRQDGILKVLEGHTTIEEVRANCNNI